MSIYVDFLRMASLLPLNHHFSGVSSTVLLKLFRTGRFETGPTANLYGGYSSTPTVSKGEECYGVLTLTQLQNLLGVGLQTADIATDSPSLVFATDPGMQQPRTEFSLSHFLCLTPCPGLVFLFICVSAVAISLFSSSSSAHEKTCFGDSEVVPPLSSIEEGNGKGKPAPLQLPARPACVNLHEVYADENIAAEQMSTYKAARNAKLVLLVR